MVKQLAVELLTFPCLGSSSCSATSLRSRHSAPSHLGRLGPANTMEMRGSLELGKPPPGEQEETRVSQAPDSSDQQGGRSVQ
ncbi:hypothetical protein HispidOSU_006852 [Sigmodon hispidus]